MFIFFYNFIIIVFSSRGSEYIARGGHCLGPMEHSPGNAAGDSAPRGHPPAALSDRSVRERDQLGRGPRHEAVFAVQEPARPVDGGQRQRQRERRLHLPGTRLRTRLQAEVVAAQPSEVGMRQGSAVPVPVLCLPSQAENAHRPAHGAHAQEQHGHAESRGGRRCRLGDRRQCHQARGELLRELSLRHQLMINQER